MISKKRENKVYAIFYILYSNYKKQYCIVVKTHLALVHDSLNIPKQKGIYNTMKYSHFIAKYFPLLNSASDFKAALRSEKLRNFIQNEIAFFYVAISLCGYILDK